MAAYDRCSKCNGSGNLACESCKCSHCSASGKVQGPCSCRTGTIPCQRCEGTGQILIKKGFFSDKYGACYVCNGSRQAMCPSCKGKSTIPKDCPRCGGRGRDSRCAVCGGSAKVTCTSCSGSGRIESEWFVALRGAPLDQVRFEYEKRQNAVGTLHLKISRWSVELAHDYEEDSLDRRENASNYYGDGSEVIFENEGKIKRAEKQIREIEEEMEAIGTVLQAKWRE